MKFRPCIDIHDGKVKQIVGGSLRDSGEGLKENFVSSQDAAFFAGLYRDRGLAGGHVILLNKEGTPGYEATRQQAFKALRAYPGGLMAGGGITPVNAAAFLDAGASHVIVTSYVFRDGEICRERLEELKKAVGPERLVLDLSCRRKDGLYYIMTDRWQRFTEVPVSLALMEDLGSSCAEFLIHAVDVEGQARGIEADLAILLSGYEQRPVTYAGGIGKLQDLEDLYVLGKGRLDFTIGSALDLFGGTIPFEKAAQYIAE